jgi:hypothetical protein
MPRCVLTFVALLTLSILPFPAMAEMAGISIGGGPGGVAPAVPPGCFATVGSWLDAPTRDATDARLIQALRQGVALDFPGGGIGDLVAALNQKLGGVIVLDRTAASPDATGFALGHTAGDRLDAAMLLDMFCVRSRLVVASKAGKLYIARNPNARPGK